MPKKEVDVFKIILIVLFCHVVLFASPLWYAEHTYKSQDQLYYGYGEGETAKVAQQAAAAEISEQISTHVSSSLKIEQTDTSSDVRSNTVTTSSATLKAMRVVKRTLKDGRFYVLISYHYKTPSWFEEKHVDAPLFSKVGYGFGTTPDAARTLALKDLQLQLKGITLDTVYDLRQEKVGDYYYHALAYRSVPKLKCSSPQSPFLAHSTLIQEANRLTECDYDYALRRFNKRWYLQYDNDSFALSKAQFASFFTSITNPNIALSTKQTTLREGDEFQMLLKSRHKGYLTLFNVYEDGRVGTVLSNRITKAKESFNYPSIESKQVFTAGLLKVGKPTTDLFVLVWSPQKLDLSRFRTQGSSYVGKSDYRFDDVIALCDKHEFSTLVIKTEP